MVFHLHKQGPFLLVTPHNQFIITLDELLTLFHALLFRSSGSAKQTKPTNSKTYQANKGHYIYIFNLQSLIQLFCCPQIKVSPDPLFTDDSNRPTSRFWFQKHLKTALRLFGFPTGHSFWLRHSYHSSPKRSF